MTLIVYRDGVMAADTASWVGGVAVSLDAEKVHFIRGDLVGCCGDVTDIVAFREWWERTGGKPPLPKMAFPKEFGAICAGAERAVVLDGRGFVSPMEFGTPGIAIGCETAFVNGLLIGGKSAIDCVQIAIERCAWVAGRVQWRSLVAELVDP